MDATQDGLSQRRRSLDNEPRREDRDESALRAGENRDELTGCVNEDSLELSQQRELTTGAPGSDGWSCYDSAGRTPPTPLTGRSAKREIRPVVHADHEAPGQHMQRRPQESQDVMTPNGRVEIQR